MSGRSHGWTRQTGARLIGFLTCSLALGACTSLPRTPYTAAEASTSRVLDIDGLRRYADEPIAKFSFEKDTGTATKSYLALSGGGADGAYGVGVLNGWTAARTPSRLLGRLGCEHRRPDCALCVSRLAI
ncbi:hypothetical protein ACVWWK_005374 [Bradyrhizobium sp. LB9.1b]